MRTFEIELRHFLRFDLAYATIQLCNQNRKRLKTLLHSISFLVHLVVISTNIIIAQFDIFVKVGDFITEDIAFFLIL